MARDLMGILQAVAGEPDSLVEDFLAADRRRVSGTSRSSILDDTHLNPGHSRTTPDRRSGIELSLLLAGKYPGAAPGHDGLTLLTEAARFADRNGFRALWLLSDESAGQSRTSASSAVMGAAVAVLTDRIDIRGGVSFQAQNPVRIAEEWSVVDNLSHGRAALTFGCLEPPDRPPSQTERRRDNDAALRNSDIVQRLWQGDGVNFPGVHGKEVLVKTLPLPMQTSLPLWVLARDVSGGGLAAEFGAGLLIDLRVASIQDLGAIIRTYRHALATRQDAATARCSGRVAAVVPTFVGVDGGKSEMAISVAQTSVASPIIPHLQGLIAVVEQEAALTRCPTAPIQSVESENDIDARMLCGTPDQCIEKITALEGLGVDEIACWIDFGLDPEFILSGFDGLRQLVESRGGLATPGHAPAGQCAAFSETTRACDPIVDGKEVDAASGRARTRRDMTRRRKKPISRGTNRDEKT